MSFLIDEVELKHLQITAMGTLRRQAARLSFPEVQLFTVIFWGTGDKNVSAQRGV